MLQTFSFDRRGHGGIDFHTGCIQSLIHFFQICSILTNKMLRDYGSVKDGESTALIETCNVEPRRSILPGKRACTQLLKVPCNTRSPTRPSPRGSAG